MGVNLKFPLRSFRKGFFEMNDTTIDAVKEDIKILLLTKKGERVVNSSIGTNIPILLGEMFEPIKKNEMVNFKDFFRKANVFIIDDIQFIRGKEGLQEEFFHTFNSLFDKSAQIIISSDRPPNRLDRVQDRIKSRLSGGLVVDIGVPDYDLKLNILKKKINEFQNSFHEYPNLSEDIIEYMAREPNLNIRELIGIFNRVVAFSKMNKKPLNVNDCK